MIANGASKQRAAWDLLKSNINKHVWNFISRIKHAQSIYKICLIYIRKLPQIGGWFKADYKAEIDHEDDEDYSSILEFQFGKMFTPRIGAYVEGFIGDDVLSTDAYNKGVGIGLRFMY